jgi:hypothetical protein
MAEGNMKISKIIASSSDVRLVPKLSRQVM